MTSVDILLLIYQLCIKPFAIRVKSKFVRAAVSNIHPETVTTKQTL